MLVSDISVFNLQNSYAKVTENLSKRSPGAPQSTGEWTDCDRNLHVTSKASILWQKEALSRHINENVLRSSDRFLCEPKTKKSLSTFRKLTLLKARKHHASKAKLSKSLSLHIIPLTERAAWNPPSEMAKWADPEALLRVCRDHRTRRLLTGMAE